MSDYISRADAIDAVAQQWLFEASVGNPYVNDDDIGEYRKLAEELFEDVPSADAEHTDCTEFVNWLTEVVMDDEDWELNAVAYGEVICRKLVKLGILEVTEEPSYYIRPSANADGEDLIIKGAKGIQDGLYNIKDGKLFKYKAKGGTVRTYPIVPSADADRPHTVEELKEFSGLVRCKDCRWYENRYGEVCHNPRYGDGHANYSPPYVDEEYFCKDGERSE